MSESDVASWREAFSLFDKRGENKIPVSALGDLLRACGQNPTEAEIADLAAANKGADLDFQGFRRVLERPGGFDSPGDKEDLLRGFQVFDKQQTGYLGVGELRFLLTKLGEPMADHEVDELIKGVDVKDGQVHYGDFVDMILSN
ncbi:myosin II light chain [Savitreella phatthalungensis]